MHGWIYAVWCLGGTLLYYGASSIVLKHTIGVYEYDIQMPRFTNFYWRGDTVYDSEFFDAGKFAYWMIMVAAGFTFVNVVNLTNYRHNPILDNHMSPASFYKTMAFVAPAMFALSMNINIRGKQDLVSKFAEVPDYNITVEQHYEKVMFENNEIMMLAASFQHEFKEFSQKAAPYTDQQVYHYNYYVWTLALFIGLQFMHLDTGILSKITLDWNVMKNWPAIVWAIFAGLIGLLIFLVRFLVKTYFSLHIVKGFAVGFGLFGAWFYYKSRGATDIHIHHYCLGMAIISISSYQDWLITTVTGIFTGIMVDGLSRWGMDPVFSYNKLPEKEEAR